MDTIRAVAHMASEHADRNDPVRKAENARLSSATRQSMAARSTAIGDERLIGPVNQVLAELHDMGMRPADDRATQLRVASAVDRAVAAGPEVADVAPAIMRDYMLQEAAAARLAGTGSMDPLAAISDPASARAGLDAASRLREMAGIHAHAIFDRASPNDMSAIAAGRYDMVAGGNTAFAIATQLRMSAETLMTREASPERRTTPGKGPAETNIAAGMTRSSVTR
jgi:hypothetical protein